MMKNNGKTQWKGVILLLITAMIWGTAFTAQSVGMESVGPFTFNAIRMLMGAATLLPVILVRNALRARRQSEAERAQQRARTRRTVKNGLLLGIAFCAASNVQQFAFFTSTPGKIAFITALYMFFVPLIGLLFRKRIPLLTWFCVVLGFVGLYFLCVNPENGFSLVPGDLLALGCSALFAVQILLIERFSADSDGLLLSCIQFASAGVISAVLMLLTESPTAASIHSALLPLLYAGVMSCGIAYTFQILGQRYTEATVASLIMCMEAVFGALAGALLLNERLSARELFGCGIMFAAIVLAQFADRITLKKKA